MNFKKLTDHRLTELLRGAGSDDPGVAPDQEAFEEIYKRYWLKLLQVAWQKTGKREASEELVQDLFVSLWERRSELQIRGSLNNYLHTAIRYRIINFIRAEILSSRHLQTVKSHTPSADNGTEKQIYFQELGNNLQASIEKLPQKSRTIFELSRGQHFSNKQIAGKLNISEKTVEYHLSKSLRLLRVYLRDFVTVLVLYAILS